MKNKDWLKEEIDQAYKDGYETGKMHAKPQVPVIPDYVAEYIEDQRKTGLDSFVHEANPATSTKAVRWFYDGANDTLDFALTEQEIKDYDERYWAFAKKVDSND